MEWPGEKRSALRPASPIYNASFSGLAMWDLSGVESRDSAIGSWPEEPLRTMRSTVQKRANINR